MKDSLLHIIENPSRRMQRLGFLKYVVYQASNMRTSSLHVLGNKLIDSVSKKVWIPATPELAEYLKVTLREQRNKSLLDKVEKAIQRSETDQLVSVQLQDAYLSSKDLPSRRGRLVPRDSTNYPRLASSLGLLRKDSFSPLVRGQMLLQLVSKDELNAFSEYSKDTNPLILTLEQKILFLFTLIECDEHLLLPLYRALLSHKAEFADWEAGDLLPGIIREVCRQFRPSVQSGADAAHLQRLLKTAETIEQWRGKEYKGTGARDETATIRLEPFVDLGLLFKKNPLAYRYEFTPIGRYLMSELTKEEERLNLDTNFFSLVTAAFGLSTIHISELNSIMEFVYLSFRKLASPLGYAPIREVLLLAAILAVNTGRGYFELAEGLEALQAIRQRHPNLVRLNVDRMGKMTLVKFTTMPPVG